MSLQEQEFNKTKSHKSDLEKTFFNFDHNVNGVVQLDDSHFMVTGKNWSKGYVI